MATWLLFLLLSIPVIILSWQPLLHPKSHGFPRFFAWEGIVWLFANNVYFWFQNPFSLWQIISWLLLFSSIYPAVSGFLLLRRTGSSDRSRNEHALYDFEKTARIVQTGIYKYIRHPLYLSLILLCWGILFKNPEWHLVIAAILVTLLLYITARRDERECIAYFGKDYSNYMNTSKMFIPFIF